MFFRRKKPGQFTFHCVAKTITSKDRDRENTKTLPLYINVFHFKHAPNDRFSFLARRIL